jgi:hypothetical protein
MVSLTRTLLAGVAIIPATLFGQGVTVKNVSDMQMYGGLGAMASLAMRMGGGGSMHNIESTTYLLGHKLRNDTPTNGSIVDLDGGRLTMIDHKQKTYTSMTFAEMAEMMKRAQASAQQQMQEAKREQAKDPNAPKGDMKVNYKVSVDRPGEHEKISGYDAERVFMTITLEGEATPEGGKTEQVGNMVFLMDQWMSKDAPQNAAYKEFGRAYAEKVGEAYKSQAQGLQALFATNPKMKEGFEAAAKEMQKVQGIPLRSMTYVVLVPPNQTFDRKLALNDASAAAAKANEEAKDEKKGGGGLKGLMGKMKKAAEDANKQPPPDDKAPPKQATLMSLKDEVQSITSGAPADVFSPPAGYKEVKPRMQ